MFNLGYDDYEKFSIHLYWSIPKSEWIKAVKSNRKILFVSSNNEAYILNDKGELVLL